MESSAQNLTSFESILLDKKSDRYLVSSAVEGVISSVSLSGDVSVFGLDAKGSHGLAQYSGYLYSCSKSTVYCYDIETETLLGSYAIPGAVFLNGMCSDSEGFLYLTDFSKRLVYRIEINRESGAIGQIEQWMSTDRIPNGIAYDAFRDELVILTWGSDAVILCVDRQTKSLKYRIETGYSNLESIFIDDKGDAYVSAWSPAFILKFEQGVRSSPVECLSDDLRKPTGLLLTEDGDLLYLSSESSIIHGLTDKSVVAASGIGLTAFPNPVSINSLITYEIDQPGFVNISVFDCRGELVNTLLSESKSPGSHRFFYERGENPSGLYFISIQSEDGSEAIAVTLVD